jgi:hypothetical protein
MAKKNPSNHNGWLVPLRDGPHHGVRVRVGAIVPLVRPSAAAKKNQRGPQPRSTERLPLDPTLRFGEHTYVLEGGADPETCVYTYSREDT